MNSDQSRLVPASVSEARRAAIRMVPSVSVSSGNSFESSCTLRYAKQSCWRELTHEFNRNLKFIIRDETELKYTRQCVLTFRLILFEE